MVYNRGMASPVSYAIPAFAVLIAVEAWWELKNSPATHNSKDVWHNIAIGLISVATGAFLALGYGAIYAAFYALAPYKFPVDAWWSWVILFFLDDLAYYWFHRISHECRLLWNFHVVHHSSNHYNLSVAVRQSWFSGFTHWIFYAPLMLIGFAPWMFVITHGFNLIHQFWIHTDKIRSLGPLEYIINSPSHHRVHHGVNDHYLDKNYAGVFIFWDRLFGTFAEEKETPTYGITNPLESYNPLWVNTHAWVEMFAVLRTKRTVIGKLRTIFGSPNMDFEEEIPLISKGSAIK